MELVYGQMFIGYGTWGLAILTDPEFLTLLERATRWHESLAA